MKTRLKSATSVLALLVPFLINAQAPQSPPPIANFSASPNIVCVGEPVQFTDMSAGEPTSWAWTFSGGTPSVSTLQNPVVIYQTAGQFNAVLTASNSSGVNSNGKLNIVTVQACLGLNEFKTELKVDIYPNPVQTVFKIKSDDDRLFSLRNIFGVELISGNLIANEVRVISLEHYPAGIYYFTVREGNVNKTCKIIKE